MAPTKPSPAEPPQELPLTQATLPSTNKPPKKSKPPPQDPGARGAEPGG